jgi:hypothetical protein
MEVYGFWRSIASFRVRVALRLKGWTTCLSSRLQRLPHLVARIKWSRFAPPYGAASRGLCKRNWLGARINRWVSTVEQYLVTTSASLTRLVSRPKFNITPTLLVTSYALAGVFGLCSDLLFESRKPWKSAPEISTRESQLAWAIY